MFKKIAALVVAIAMVCTMAAMFTGCGANEDFKIGVILIGDETEGYSLAHITGIKAAAKALGLKDSQIEWKYKIGENSAALDAATDLVGSGCSVVVANSYGHQTFMAQAAEQFPEVTFLSMTGDFAAISGLPNLKNAFTAVYESRFVSGVVAGLKIEELLTSGELTAEKQPNSFDADGNVKVGYVGAYPYAEVISGYTAFYLGIKSIVPNVVMEVNYTNSWFDIEAEAAAAEALIANGAVIIGQHADSTGAPSATQKLLNNGTICYSIGYNIDMLDTAPTAALTSATNVWEKYYTYAFETAMKGEEIASDWAKGYSADAVAITTLGPSCAAGTAEKVAEVEAALKAGTLHVFDTATFTVGGQTVTTNPVDLSFIDWSTMTTVYQGETVETIVDGYFSESTFRSSPYFTLIIDGITAK